MKLLFLEWKSLCNEDIIPEFERMGHTVVRLPYDERNPKEEQNARMDMELEKGYCDMLEGRVRPAADVFSDIRKEYNL